MPPLHPCSPTFHLIIFVPPPSTFPSGLNLHRSTLNSVVNSLPEAKQKLKQTPVKKIKNIKKRKKETKKSKKKPLSCRYVSHLYGRLRPPARPFARLFVRPHIRPTGCPYICPYIRPSVHPWYPSVYSSVYLFICPSAFQICGDLTAM